MPSPGFWDSTCEVRLFASLPLGYRAWWYDETDLLLAGLQPAEVGRYCHDVGLVSEEVCDAGSALLRKSSIIGAKPTAFGSSRLFQQMGTIWLHPVLWASWWQMWCDLFIWSSLEQIDFANDYFFCSNVAAGLSKISGNVSIQVKLACKHFLIFSSQWSVLLLIFFAIWGLKDLNVSNCVFTFLLFCMSWLLLSKARLHEGSAVS